MASTHFDPDTELAIIKNNLDEFRKCLPGSVTAATEPFMPKVTFKLAVYREALLWRTIELGDGAVAGFEAKNLLSAIILTRCVQESAAAVFHFAETLQRHIRANTAIKLNESAMKMLLGSRVTEREFESINILTLVDKVDKEIPGFRGNYDQMSEFLHPNFNGVALLFSNPQNEYDVDFGRYVRGYENNRSAGLTSLKTGLMIFNHYYNVSSELLYKIVDICQRDLEEG